MYDEDGVVIGHIDEPLWSVADLSQEESVGLGRRVSYALNERDRLGIKLSDHQVYHGVLCELGIACPHVWKGEAIPNLCGTPYPTAFLRKGQYANIGLECLVCGIVQVNTHA